MILFYLLKIGIKDKDKDKDKDKGKGICIIYNSPNK